MEAQSRNRSVSGPKRGRQQEEVRRVGGGRQGRRRGCPATRKGECEDFETLERTVYRRALAAAERVAKEIGAQRS